MLLLDTSAWIEVFRKEKPHDLGLLGGLDEVVTCPPVVQEVLQGFRDEAAALARVSPLIEPSLGA